MKYIVTNLGHYFEYDLSGTVPLMYILSIYNIIYRGYVCLHFMEDPPFLQCIRWENTPCKGKQGFSLAGWFLATTLTKLKLAYFTNKPYKDEGGGD